MQAVPVRPVGSSRWASICRLGSPGELVRSFLSRQPPLGLQMAPRPGSAQPGERPGPPRHTARISGSARSERDGRGRNNLRFGEGTMSVNSATTASISDNSVVYRV